MTYRQLTYTCQRCASDPVLVECVERREWMCPDCSVRYRDDWCSETGQKLMAYVCAVCDKAIDRGMAWQRTYKRGNFYGIELTCVGCRDLPVPASG